MKRQNSREPITRLSISLPQSLATQLDQLVEARGFETRSQAITEMIHQQLLEQSRQMGEDVVTGTITLSYQHTFPQLKARLAEIQYKHVAEVISSLHVYLEHEQTLEVILVQGPANKLRAIADELITCKGVKTGRLQFASAILPPIHGRG
jgi:CopG family nickel-responsive transcriptional regulator